MKRRIFSVLFTLIASLAFFAACTEPKVEEVSLNLYDGGYSPKSVEIGRIEQVKNLRLVASHDWTLQIKDNPSWVTITPNSGTPGVRQLDIAVQTNGEADNRKCTVDFISVGEVRYTLEIVQLGKGKDDTPDQDPNKKGPTADMLDVVFYGNGVAKDVSKNEYTIKHVSGSAHMNYYSDMYERYIAHFNHTLGSNPTDGYYMFDFAGNTDFINQLKDGHSLEVVFSLGTAHTGASEVKMFSSHQAGGTGFLLATSGRGSTLHFLPNVSENGSSNWIWTDSKINPTPGKFYHAVGVWDKKAGKAHIYVNGEHKGSADAVGNLVLNSDPVYHWFGIGVDASKNAGQSAWNGDVAFARIFDEPLTTQQIQGLYEDVKKEQTGELISLSDLNFLAECVIPPNYWFNIFGKGFKEGDKIRLDSVSDQELRIEPTVKIIEGGLAVKITTKVASGKYRVLLQRGTAQFPIGIVNFNVSSTAKVTKTEVVAHRCWHENGTNDKTVPENSFAAFKRTQTLGIYGCEIDVWITKDDVVVINHNSTIPTDPKKQTIQNVNYADIQDVKLSNGEPLPTLQQFLTQMKEEPNMKLVLEIKSHSGAENNNRVVDKCIEMVKAEGLVDRVVWIAFSYDNCKRIAAALPTSMVQYLNGDKAPAQCYADGIMGIDYSSGKLTDAHIEEAHKLGMAVNVWTINDAATMLKYISKGVDFITTNDPDVCKDLLKKQYVTEN
jgi:glycerophosphoryl diester phosphodiesterase